MLELTGKVLLGSVTTIGTAIIGLGTYHSYSQPSRIGEELQKEEKLNLLEIESPKWKDLVDKHKQEEALTGNNTKKIKSLTLSKASEKEENLEDKKELQDKCNSLWNTEISKTSKDDRDRIKEEIKNWCITNPLVLKKE